MNDHSCIDFSSLTINESPFPHFQSSSVLTDDINSQLFEWFERTKEWSLTQAEFYEQYEFNCLNVDLPTILRCLVDRETISKIEQAFIVAFNINAFDLVGVVAHKLIDGQRIGIHNDFINDEETHRLVIHINPRWTEENGGFLMLFNSSKADDIANVIAPVGNSAFGFAISKQSHHAVSKIYNFSRYTLVYTFKAK